MAPKILNRQSVMFSSQREKIASAIVPMTGAKTFLRVVIPFDRATAEPKATRTARAIETILKRLISSKSFGNRTMMTAPKIAPRRDLRPPMIIPRRNRTVSSLL